MDDQQTSSTIADYIDSLENTFSTTFDHLIDNIKLIGSIIGHNDAIRFFKDCTEKMLSNAFSDANLEYYESVLREMIQIADAAHDKLSAIPDLENADAPFVLLSSEADEEHKFKAEAIESNLAATSLETDLRNIRSGLLAKMLLADLNLSPDGTVYSPDLKMDLNQLLKSTPYPIRNQSEKDILIDFSSCGAKPSTVPYNKITLQPGQTSVKITSSNTWLDGGTLNTGAKVAITIEGPSSSEGSKVNLTSAYHPSGTKAIKVGSTASFKVGDDVVVSLKPNKAWVSAINMSKYSPWKNAFPMKWYSKIAAIQNGEIILETPITYAINPKYYDSGNAYIAKHNNKRIQNIKISNLTVKMSSKSEPTGVLIRNAQNVIVDNCEFYGADRAVRCEDSAKNITVKGCIGYESNTPVQPSNRYTFQVDGQQCLVVGCVAYKPRHGFVSNDAGLTGPNVFLYCQTVASQGVTSQCHRLGNSGYLFDRVTDSVGISINNRYDAGSGHGWSSFNVFAYDCDSAISIETPPLALNAAIGCYNTHGPLRYKFEKGPSNRPAGIFISEGKQVKPDSLYLYQVKVKNTPALRAAAIDFEHSDTILETIESREDSEKKDFKND